VSGKATEVRQLHSTTCCKRSIHMYSCYKHAGSNSDYCRTSKRASSCSAPNACSNACWLRTLAAHAHLACIRRKPESSNSLAHSSVVGACSGT
jgi:hypothetical protein